MELWDLYDKNRKLIGSTMLRGDRQPEGTYRIVVYVVIFNSKGQMLIQHRQTFKDSWANYWDLTVGGSAIAGDSSQQAAEREAQEEIGYSIDLTNIAPHLTAIHGGAFVDFYIINQDVDFSSLCLQLEEVSEIKWANCDEIVHMIDEGIFIPYHKSLIQLLFHLRLGDGLRMG